MTFESNSEFSHHFVDTDKDGPPRWLGVRFDDDGTFLPTPGNTVVCHVVPGSPTQAALQRVHHGLLALPYGDRFAFTPEASWHMTVFQGVVEGRRKVGFWPDFLSLDAPIDETTAVLIDRLRAVDPPALFAMRLHEITPVGATLVPATPHDERSIRAYRDALAAPFGYRHPDHDSYTFHITLAYLKAWLPRHSVEMYLAGLRRLGDSFRAEVGTIEIGPAQFCVFDDMTEFRPVLTLG